MSYAEADQEWAEWIAWTLETAGYRVLLHAWDSVAGTHRPQSVQDFLFRADRTIALVSPNYLTSPANGWEWSAAASGDPAGVARRFVPVRIAECSPRGLLAAIVAVDLFGLDEVRARERLLRELAAIRAGRAKPARAPLFPVDSSGGTPFPNGTVGDTDKPPATSAGHTAPDGPETGPGSSSVPAPGPRCGSGPGATARTGSGFGFGVGRPRPELVACLAHGNALSRFSRSAWVGALAFVPGGELIVTAADDGLTRLWDIADPRLPVEVSRLRDHHGWVRAVACTDGAVLVTAGEDGAVVARDIRRPTVPGDPVFLDGHRRHVWAVAVERRVGLLATGDDHGRVLLWPSSGGPTEVAAASGEAGFPVPVPSGPVVLQAAGSATGALAFSPDGAVLAAGAADGVVRIWPMSWAGRPISPAHLLADHEDGVWSVAFSPDGSVLATGGDDGTVRLWRLSDSGPPARLARMDHLGRWVRAVAFSPDGALLLTAGDGDTARLWDLRRAELPVMVTSWRGVGGRVLAAAFARPDLLALGCADGRARLYELRVDQL